MILITEVAQTQPPLFKYTYNLLGAYFGRYGIKSGCGWATIIFSI